MADGNAALYTYLQTKSGVTNLISTRMYPDDLPQDNTLPCIVYRVISKVPEHDLSGASPLTRYRFQLDSYAATRIGADALAEAVRNAADGYRGTMGSEFAQTTHLDNERSDIDAAIDATDQSRYITIQDWIVSFTDTAPTL